jgi:hypothetical protein
MREIRSYGSEGGEVLTDLSYPYLSVFIGHTDRAPVRGYDTDTSEESARLQCTFIQLLA